MTYSANGYYPLETDIVRGVVYRENPNIVVDSTTRLIYENAIVSSTSLYIQANGQKYLLVQYDTNNNLTSFGSWVEQDSYVNIDSNRKIRIVFSKIDNSVITVDDLKVRVFMAADSGEMLPYFSGPTVPDFVFTKNAIGTITTAKVTFPNAQLRLYLKTGALLYNSNTFANQNYTLNFNQKLVLNPVKNTISIKAYNENTDDCITLLAFPHGSVYGVLAQYADSALINHAENRASLALSARGYLSGPTEPMFSVTKQGYLKITFLVGGDLRIYWNGTHYTYQVTANENYTVQWPNAALVYNTKTNAISVKTSESAAEDEVSLLSYTPYGADGILAPYFNNSTVLRTIQHYRAKMPPALWCQRYNESLGYIERTVCDAKIAFVSDIHKSIRPFQAMLTYTNQLGTNWFDVIINGGDTTVNLGSEDLGWYNDMVDDSVIPILNCVGNHDVWYGSNPPYSQYTPQETYQYITKKVAQTASISQPTNAETNGLNYYYKDINNVRIIVLDVMNWNSTQNTWLTNTLTNAKTNNKHVIGVVHGPFTSGNISYPDHSRNSSHIRDGYGTNIEAAQTVYQFIQGGGTFICWLSGHTHQDEIGILPDLGNQYWVAITTPRDGMTDTPKSQALDDFSYTAFDCIGVDTVNGIVKFQRVGADTNWNMIQHDKLCIDYVNHRILA